MDTDFWAARWREGRIGFHEGKTNSFLDKHVERLGQSRKVLVPLCGKAEDLAFLASRGHEVVGIEVVESAVKTFFDEHSLTPKVEKRGGVTAYSAERVTILAGDLFECSPEIVGKVDALYDRAALVALDPETRKRYVKHVRSLLAPKSPGILVTFDYDQSEMEPPPFSVKEEEVRTHYAVDQVELIDEGSAVTPRFSASGVDAIEKCFALVVHP